MSNFIKFASESVKYQNDQKKLDDFISILKEGDPKKLKSWFDGEGYTDVSPEDCEILIKNKDKILQALSDNNLKY